MKKLTILQTVFVAAIALIIGLFVGIAIKSTPPPADDLAGTIGKVDRYRNVKITEDDIMLRNELVEDTVKRAQYEKYLLYHYYQSLKTSSDVDAVLEKTTASPDFYKTYYPYAEALSSFKVFLEPARIDILNALNMIIALDENENIPVIDYLNKAQNAIARIRNNDAILMSYMEAIASFIEANPEVNYDELADAHDILELNILQSAILTQNKPMLSYLDKKKLMNEKEGIKELASEAQLSLYMQDQFAMDAESINAINSQQLQSIVYTDMNQLQSFVMGSMEQFNSVILLSADAISSTSELGNQEALQSMLNDAGNLGSSFSDMPQLGFFRSAEQLRAH